ncbi:PAS domain-containing sensor histidine kinase [Oceanicoccus sp. KOV_DT_Chl]|uniref:sensor histidine kinase n=1 Tax=Oceanicoccus sp. KOV_DT_Chl TaxID=1904639 RepID=UPI000C7DCEE7|nr:ATP-binding protein [Oceanicoccus sp. KOV_DT_Chl]
MSSPEITLDGDQQQNLALLKIYTSYRAILCIALLSTFLLATDKILVGGLNPALFVFVTTLYLLLNIIGLIVILPKRTPLTNQQLFAHFFVDIAAITLIADTSNGVGSGIGILLVVIIAAASIMLSKQLAALIAAIASIAIIGDTARLVNAGSLDIASFLPAGMLGMILFITSLLIQNLANRIRGAQLLAEQRSEDVSRLQSLNQNIVQRMRTGILVINEEGIIQLANAAASELLAIPDLEKISASKKHLPPQLMVHFKQWQANNYYRSPGLQMLDTGPELHASFSAFNLQSSNDNDTLVFIEDNRRIAQQAQQIKLASLGRLTASIAHEIRNPLGAISHAAQLLAESEQLADADKRLSDIIQNHSKRMNKVIENVLQLSRRSAPNPERVILDQWLTQFISEFESSEPGEHLIKLTGEKDCAATIDCSQLSQVVTNLVQNGLRYSLQQTGKATVQLHIHSTTDTNFPQLDIIDDGPGIDSNSKEKLFEPFYTTEAKGSGLGLYISRELCEANQARLDYLTNEQGKSCFRISFPHPDRRLLTE